MLIFVTEAQTFCPLQSAQKTKVKNFVSFIKFALRAS
jgi:hypothetical protein